MATASKPPRLDEAEALLQTGVHGPACREARLSHNRARPRSLAPLTGSDLGAPRRTRFHTIVPAALRLEGKGAAYSRAGARASTLQQLGRVSIRRGRLDQARRYLLQAVELHEAAYGSEIHVNVSESPPPQP
eukprot:COSAG01_NODE_1372_length_10545_cov_12.262876_11_plen_132_part_00